MQWFNRTCCTKSTIWATTIIHFEPCIRYTVLIECLQFDVILLLYKYFNFGRYYTFYPENPFILLHRKHENDQPFATLIANVAKAKSDILESGHVGHKHGLGPCKFTEFGDVSREDVTPASQYSGMSTMHDKAVVSDAPRWSDRDDNTSVNTCQAREGAKVSWADLVRSSKSERERAHNVNSGDNEYNNNSLDQESWSNRRGISRSKDSERYVEGQESLG